MGRLTKLKQNHAYKGKKQLPLISVIIPTYNREEYIRSCVLSAVEQTYDNIEIIIIDNNSDDGTWNICVDLSNSHDNVKAFQNDKNIGPVKNWILGINHSQGEYVKILFSDDIIFPTCLEKMYSALQNKDLGFVYSAAKVGSNLSSSQVLYRNSKEIIKSKEYFASLITGNSPYSPGAALFRSRDLKRFMTLDVPCKNDHQFAHNGAGPDVYPMLRLASNYGLVACIWEPLVFFRSHSGSFTFQNENNSIWNAYTDVLHTFFEQNGMPDLCINILSIYWLRKMRYEKRYISLRTTVFNITHQEPNFKITISIFVSAAVQTLKKVFKF